MAKYKYTSPSGAVYEFEGPDELTPELQKKIRDYAAELEGTPTGAPHSLNAKNPFDDALSVIDQSASARTETPPNGLIDRASAAEVLGTEGHGIGLAFVILAAWLTVVKLVHWARFEQARSLRTTQNLVGNVGEPGSREKVGGWLKFYAVVLTFWTPLQVLGYAGSFVGIMEEAYRIGTSATALVIQDASLSLAYLIRVHLVVSALIAALCIAVGIKIWRARPTALLWLRRLWWLDIAWQGCFLSLFLCINPQPDRWRVNFVVLAISTLSMILWRSYFELSKRVRATFGHWVCSAHRDTTIFDEIITPHPSPAPSNEEGQFIQSADDSKQVSEVAANEEQSIQAVPEQLTDKPLPPHEQINETALPRTALDCYTQIAAELERGEKHAGAWLMAVTEAGGEGPQARLLYNKLRAQMLMAAEPVNSST